MSRPIYRVRWAKAECPPDHDPIQAMADALLPAYLRKLQEIKDARKN